MKPMTLPALQELGAEMQHLRRSDGTLSRFQTDRLLDAVAMTAERPPVANRLVLERREPTDWEQLVDFWTGTSLAAYANALDMAWTAAGEIMGGRLGR